VTALPRVGDRVLFEDGQHQIAAVSGSWVRLVAEDGSAAAVTLTHLVGSPDFAILGHVGADSRSSRIAGGRLDDVPEPAAAAARTWERHIVEVETGLPPGAVPGTVPRPQYDPARYRLEEREKAKAAELTAAGSPTSLRTVQRMRARYRGGGLRALADGRSHRRVSPLGRADPRLIEALGQAGDREKVWLRHEVARCE
jgi:hypothetical protein